MFSVKKVFLGGTAVAATVLLAMSAAWACSPYANRRVSVTAGPPGTPIVIEGTDYELKYGTVTVELTNGSSFGKVLDTPTLLFDRFKEVEDKDTRAKVEISVYRFTSTVTVPMDRKPGHDYVDVRQQSATYGLKSSTVFTVQASESGPPPGEPPPTTPGTPGSTPNRPTPQITPTTRALTPGSQTGPSIGAAPPDVQRPAAAAARDLPVADGGAAAAIASEEPQARAEAKVEVGPQLPPWVDPGRDTQTLWSGLEKSDASNAATLTAPTEPPDDPSRLGAALLTLGGLVLLAGGAVAVPRRRALRRIR